MNEDGIDRSPLPYWKLNEFSVGISLSELGDVGELLHDRCADNFAEYRRKMNQDLYGDPLPFVPPTQWQKFKRWLADNRITNAWLVLVGREDIDRGY